MAGSLCFTGKQYCQRHRGLVSLLALGLTLPLLGGCLQPRQGGLAPLMAYGDKGSDGAGGAGGVAAGAISVSKNESVYDIARHHNVPVRDLIDANRLRPPYTLTPGQRLKLPVPRSYTVQRGDTLYGISRMFGTDMRELARANGIGEPYNVEPGRTVRLTGRGGFSSGPTASVDGGHEQPHAAPSAKVEVETLPPPGGGKLAADKGSSKSGVAVSSLSPPSSPSPSPSPSPSLSPAEKEKGATAGPSHASASPAVRPPVRGGPRFLRPVSGKVVSGFGPKPDGSHNDGINLAAEKGSVVAAGANGTVVYAGNELRGFGNLLLVRHADGWMTAYAHLDSMAVGKGTAVKRGQTIGTVGSSGNVSQPQLHFEVRKGSQAVDPSGYLE